MPTLIEVTQEDIDRSRAWFGRKRAGVGSEDRVSDNCPVAYAATRAFGTPMRVHLPTSSSGEPGEARVLMLHFKRRGWDNSGDVLLPDDEVRRINHFDVEQWMEPHTFEVEA